jgi:hypothetical protein
MVEKVINIKVQEKGIDETTAKINRLEQSMETLAQENDALKDSMSNSGKAVLDNGGAMGLLNMVTGGLAQTVKDAVEASALFTKSTKAQTTMQKISTTVMGTSTGALKLFRLALIATGIGAIVVALGLLIANFDSVKKAVLNLIPGLSAVGDFFGKLIDAVTDFVGVTSDATRALDKMVEDSEASLKRNEHFLEANGDKYDEYTQRKIKANIDYNKKVKELAEDEELTEEEKFARLKEFRDKANREILKAEQDRADKQEKARQDAQDKINAENQKIRDEQKKIRDAEIQRQLEAYNAGVTAEAKFLEQRRELSRQFAQEEEDEELERADRIAKEDIKRAEDKLKAEEELAKQQIEFEKNKNDVIANSQQNLAKILSGIETAGLAKTKAGQAISKALAITQIGIDSAVALSKASTLANAEGVAAQLAFPTLPGVGTIARVVSYASTAAQVIGNISRAKGLLSGGGNASGGGGSSSSSTPSGGGSAPSFNLVQGTGTNQIAEGLANQTRPLKAYVVGSDVSTQQSLDRNIVESARL